MAISVAAAAANPIRSSTIGCASPSLVAALHRLQRHPLAVLHLIQRHRAAGDVALAVETDADIARQQAIPQKFLERILLDLKNRGYLQSRRGANGGYALLKPASSIMFGEILRLIDGPIAPLPCLSITAYRPCDDCAAEATCEVRRVFAAVAEAERAVLDRTSIADATTGRAPASASKKR